MKEARTYHAIVHAVEVGAVAEMLEGEDRIIKRHPRHHVIAIDDTVILVA